MTTQTQTQPLRGPLRKRESHLWRRDPLDWYVEPEWCSERLFEMEKFEGLVYDPFAGLGRIVKAAGARGRGSDIEPRDPSVQFLDFKVVAMYNGDATADNIVSNPPFGQVDAFLPAILRLAQRKVALLLPANWVQGDKRSRWLETTPLRRVLFLTPRPSMPPGAVVLAGGKPGNGTTDYAWFIWDHEQDPLVSCGLNHPTIGWCRR
jgi:hypothetical protein